MSHVQVDRARPICKLQDRPQAQGKVLCAGIRHALPKVSDPASAAHTCTLTPGHTVTACKASTCTNRWIRLAGHDGRSKQEWKVGALEFAAEWR